MAANLSVSFAPVDYLNPKNGYELTIVDTDLSADRRQQVVLFNGTRDGLSGRDLMTPADCLRVVQWYVTVGDAIPKEATR